MYYEKRKWTELPFGVQWRAGLVRLPRLVPKSAIRITSPEGPYPVVIKLPARDGGRTITTWLFLPPRSRIPDSGSVAIHIDFHGGGFIMGSCLEQAPFCAKVARERGCIVLCPDYCLSPIYSFPSALWDAEDVISAALDIEMNSRAGQVLQDAIKKHYLPSRWDFRRSSRSMAEDRLRVDPNRLSLSGFSAGGNLALNAVLSTTEDWPCCIPKEAPAIPVILFYPQFEQTQLPHERSRPPGVPKPGKFAQSLSNALIPLWLPPELRNDPRANPGFVELEKMHEKARFFVVFSEYDTLRLQSEEWVKKMHEGGKDDILTIFNAKGTSHGFANFPEKFLSKEHLKTKQEAYGQMMEFWDKVVVEAGYSPGVHDTEDDGKRVGSG